MTSRGLLVQSLVFLAAVTVANALLARYAGGHFLPITKLARVLAQPEPGLVFVGDSRMVAAMDYPTLRESLDRRGIAIPIDDLAIGAVDFNGQSLLLRDLRRRKPAMAGLVLGICGDTLLESPGVPDPDTFLGNVAVMSVYSQPADVFSFYPGFPIAHLDVGLRFLASRSCALAAYRSLIWMKVRVAQDRLVGRVEEYNAFGAFSDMARLAESLQDEARARFQSARTAHGWRLNPRFLRLRDDLRRSGTPLILVELPMPEVFRKNIIDRADSRAFRKWLGEQVAVDGGHYIDLSDPGPLGVTDGNFPDHVHVDKPGAVRISTTLGERLADFLARRGQPETPR